MLETSIINVKCCCSDYFLMYMLLSCLSFMVFLNIYGTSELCRIRTKYPTYCKITFESQSSNHSTITAAFSSLGQTPMLLACYSVLILNPYAS